MTGNLIPVLWVSGPPGVGKTAVGWEMFNQLTCAGMQTGYVDIDQLGMCYPEPDPGRHLLKARNLGAVVTNFQLAGSRCVIVSGVVDPVHGVAPGVLSNAALTVVRLRADRAELTRRFVSRDGDSGALADALAEADMLDAADLADRCVDTSGLPVTEVVRRVFECAGDWPGPTSAPPPAEPRLEYLAADTDGPILWLCGATGVGKSTAGFEVYLRIFRTGLTAAYIDLAQLGFMRPAVPDDPGGHRLKASNAAALWSAFRAAGAQYMVMVGQVDSAEATRPYVEALPAATISLLRLHAGRDQLTSRILLRGRGGSWPEPGDQLIGLPDAKLGSIAGQAAADADALDQAAVGDLRINTGGCSVEQTAELILAQLRGAGRL